MHSNLIKKFKNFLWRERLFAGGEKIIIGISGGADSVCLTELLLSVQKKFDLKLQLVHINYHLRGKASDADERFVRQYAQKKGLKLMVFDYNRASYGKQQVKEMSTGNLEERLRNFRYKIFEKIRKNDKAQWIVVGHHQDDQTETFLLNLFRGAGVDGLKGMKIKDEQRKILRPLLSFSKQEIKKFLQEIKQDWREDQSNQDDVFLRNKIRHQLIPEIEREYSPRFKEKVKETTERLQECQKIIQEITDKKYRQVVSDVADKKTGTKYILDITEYKKMSAEIRPLLFRQIIKNLKGDLRNITNANYQEFQKIIQSTKGKKQKMSLAGIQINRSGERVVFEKKE
jgi:tRNA(Ile)-lysidine synthase